MTLTRKELQLARLALCLLYHSLKNEEDVGLTTMIEAFRDAGIPEKENPMSGLNIKELLAAVEKLVPPDPNTELARALEDLGTVAQATKEAGIGEQLNPLTDAQEG